MRVRITDPLEIVKAFEKEEKVYPSLESMEEWTEEEVDLSMILYPKINVQFWIDQTTWQDDLKHILDAKWVTVDDFGNKWLRIDMADLNNKEECIWVGRIWYSYEEAIQKIKPVKG